MVQHLALVILPVDTEAMFGKSMPLMVTWWPPAISLSDLPNVAKPDEGESMSLVMCQLEQLVPSANFTIREIK